MDRHQSQPSGSQDPGKSGIIGDWTTKQASYYRCERKVPHHKWSKAEKHARQLTQKKGLLYVAYNCIDCPFIHVGRAAVDSVEYKEWEAYNNRHRQVTKLEETTVSDRVDEKNSMMCAKFYKKTSDSYPRLNQSTIFQGRQCFLIPNIPSAGAHFVYDVRERQGYWAVLSKTLRTVLGVNSERFPHATGFYVTPRVSNVGARNFIDLRWTPTYATLQS
jgi:hypothetical protein